MKMNIEQVEQKLEQTGEPLIVGRDIDFPSAWKLYPRLRINSSRTTDYIDAVLDYERERPLFGIWANPPQFSYADGKYELQWELRLNED